MCLLVAAHAQRNRASARTDHRHNGTLPNMAVMGRTKRRGLVASSYSLQVSALVIQSSASESGLSVGPSIWESVTYASHLFNCEAYGKYVSLLGCEIILTYDG